MFKNTRRISYLSGIALLAFVADVAAETLNLGTVFSSNQTTSQSFLRFYNSGPGAGTATVQLQDSSTGFLLGTWTSPSIPANAEAQYLINKPEDEADATFTKPNFYTVIINPSFSGSFQHVLWKPTDGTLTNLSTCAGNVTSTIDTVIAFHTTVLDNGYPSTLVVSNSGISEATAELGIYDARDGSSLGTFTTAIIPTGGQVFLTAADIEAGINVTPASDMYHYNIVVENVFNGYLQHTVNNEQVGVVTDMTALCALTADSATPTSTFEGIISGADNEGGLLNIDIETEVTASSSSSSSSASSFESASQVEKPQAIASASGTYTPDGGNSFVSLSGTYDDSSQAVNVSGSGYSFSGSVDTENGTQRLSGTYTSPTGSGGFATNRRSATNLTNARFCGNWSGTVDGGFVEGTWNFTIKSSGLVSGRTANKTDGDNQNMSGVIKGNSVTGTTSDGTTWQGTIVGSDFSGSFNSEGDTGQLTGDKCSGSI